MQKLPGAFSLETHGGAPAPADLALARALLSQLLNDPNPAHVQILSKGEASITGAYVEATVIGSQRRVVITQPTAVSTPSSCKPLTGKLGTPVAFNYPQLFFPNWPNTDPYLSRLVPYMEDIYSFNAPDQLYKYDPTKDTLTQIPVSGANAPQVQWSDLMAVCVYLAPTGKLRFVLLTYNLTTVYEYEIGTGWLPSIVMSAPQDITALGVMLPGIDNSRAPLWGQANQLTVGAVVPNYNGHMYEWVVTGYDYIKRTPVPVKTFAYYDEFLADLGAGTYGRAANVVAATANGDYLAEYYDAASQSYNIPDKLTLYQVHLDSSVVGSGLIGLRFNPVAGAQICAHSYGVGAFAIPRFVDAPSPGYYDYQLLPDYSQVIDLDIATGEVWHRGSLPFSTTDAELLFTQSESVLCVALANALLIFYPTFERNSNDPSDPSLPHFTATAMNMVRMT